MQVTVHIFFFHIIDPLIQFNHSLFWYQHNIIAMVRRHSKLRAYSGQFAYCKDQLSVKLNNTFNLGIENNKTAN